MMILDHRLSLNKTAPPKSTDHHETEKPPPYTQPNLPLPLPERPSPFPSTSCSSRPPASAASDFSIYADPPPTLNQVHLHSKKEDLVGTFYINPLTPSLTPGRRKKRGSRRGTTPPHASFQSRTGAISLALATAGDFQESPKALVSVGSRRGNIEIRLLPTPPTRPRIGLDASSKSGDVTLWLPETFSGVIQLNTKKGELHVLPVLFKMAKVLKETDKEAILVMGTQAEGDLTDLCQLSTRTGKVMVGLSGRDRHPEKTGFWKKLAQFLRG